MTFARESWYWIARGRLPSLERLFVTALALVVALARPALGLAQDDPPAVSLAPDPGFYLVKPDVPVIPVREREVWFRDSWSVRMNAGYGTDSSLGEIVGGDFDVDSDNASLIGDRHRAPAGRRLARLADRLRLAPGRPAARSGRRAAARARSCRPRT